MVTQVLLLLATFLLLTADLPAQPAKDADTKKVEQVLDYLASDLIIKAHFRDYEGSAIEIVAARTEWPLNWRLAFGYLSVPGNALIVKLPVFKKLLDARLKDELLTNKSRLDTAGFFESHVKAKALFAQSRDRIKGYRETRVKLEIDIGKAVEPEKVANIVHVISMLESAGSKELEESRKKVKDALRKALHDDPASLKSLVEANANAEKVATDELRKSRASLTKSIEEAQKK